MYNILNGKMQPVTAHKIHIFMTLTSMLSIPDYFIIINSLYIVREDLTSIENYIQQELLLYILEDSDFGFFFILIFIISFTSSFNLKLSFNY